MKLEINYQDISGVIKKGRYYILRPLELKLLKRLIPLVPSWLETYHLTLFTLPLALLIFLASFLAKNNSHWIHLHSLAIVFQYLSDALDGEIGRQRHTGLVKWGFYMDHFLDFVFVSSIVLSYAIIFPQNQIIFFLFLVVIGGYFAHELLVAVSVGTYNVRGYHGIGGPEAWLGLIIINTYIAFYQPTKATVLFSLILFLLFVVLLDEVYQTQKRLWKLDMKIKKEVKKKNR